MKSLAQMVVENSKEKIPLGTLLLADNVILPQDLDFALDHQKFSKELLGEILVKIGALKHEELDKVLKLQSRVLPH
jgi:hypothetical protein